MRGRTRSIILGAALGLLLALCADAGAGAARAAQPREPFAVVEQYLTALNHHDGAAVCRTFAPRLRTFEIAQDTPMSGRRTCAATVDAHFHNYYSAHRWASAQVVRVLGTLIDPARALALVRLTLAHRYICVGRGTVEEPCHPDVERRPEYIWLIHEASGWQLIKPGLVYRASEIESAADDESIFYPPGDATTITAPVTVPAPRFRCPASRATVADHTGDVENFAGLHPPWVKAPWLDVRRLSVSRIDGHTLCFTLTLGAPPRADSAYGVGIVRELGGQVETGTGFGMAIDGVGGIHVGRDGASAIVTPSITPSLPRYGLAGNRLEFAVAAPWPRQPRAEFHVQASTSSLQTDEPLLTHPLDAGDLIVPDRGCLKFPTGGITLAGICANVPGP